MLVPSSNTPAPNTTITIGAVSLTVLFNGERGVVSVSVKLRDEKGSAIRLPVPLDPMTVDEKKDFMAAKSDGLIAASVEQAMIPYLKRVLGAEGFKVVS